MKKGMAITLFILAFFIFIGIFIAIFYFSVSNAEISLRERIEAQQESNEAVFDNTWKIIQQQAQVADEYKNAFQDIYPDLISGRYDQGDGSLMKWIQESNPNFDTKLYDRLMQSIEAQRNKFTNGQNKLIDLKREHDTMLKKFPYSIILTGREEMDIKIITSTKTEETFESRKEEDINLFK